MLSGDVKSILLLLVFVVLGISMTFFSADDSGMEEFSAGDTTLAKSNKKAPFHRGKDSSDHAPLVYYQVPETKRELFPFDPNKADSTQLLRLGLSPWQVRNIYKYRAKNGIYRTKQDFARLYGLTVEHYKALEPYIRISDDYLPASTLFKDSFPQRDTTLYPVKLKPSERIVLNTADTTALKRVPGIGSGFARRIKSYGDRLGGYVSVDQLDEIDGFPAEAKEYFVVQSATTKRLNLNTMSLDVLKKHPYMGFHRAKAIVDYRSRYGRINSLNELKLNNDFPPSVIERLEPYVEY